jgi:flagellar motor switch protein FliM
MNETQLTIAESTSESIEESATHHERTLRIEDHPAWPTLSQLSVRLTVQIHLQRIKVCDLLRLDKGQILESSWSQTNDVPVAVGERRLCWGEFEVSGQQIGVRVTQLI